MQGQDWKKQCQVFKKYVFLYTLHRIFGPKSTPLSLWLMRTLPAPQLFTQLHFALCLPSQADFSVAHCGAQKHLYGRYKHLCGMWSPAFFQNVLKGGAETWTWRARLRWQQQCGIIIRQQCISNVSCSKMLARHLPTSCPVQSFALSKEDSQQLMQWEEYIHLSHSVNDLDLFFQPLLLYSSSQKSKTSILLLLQAG